MCLIPGSSLDNFAFFEIFIRAHLITVLASHDISAGECAGYSAAAGDLGTAVNAALSSDDGKVSNKFSLMRR